jgi:hypothetical protein
MAGIPPQLLNQLRQTLLQCEQFESDRKLRTIFTYEPLRPWRSSLPQADSLTSRVDNLIRFLVEKHRSDTKENALVLFLHLLSEQIDEADERHQQLADLAFEVERVISSSDKTNISKANINSDKLSKYLENIRQKLIKEGCISPQNAVSHEDKHFNLVGKITNFELSFGFFNMRGDAFFIFSYFDYSNIEIIRRYSNLCLQYATEKSTSSPFGQFINVRMPSNICFAITIVDDLNENTKHTIRDENPFDIDTDILWYKVPVVYCLNEQKLYYYDRPSSFWENFKGEIVWKRLREVIEKILKP